MDCATPPTPTPQWKVSNQCWIDRAPSLALKCLSPADCFPTETELTALAIREATGCPAAEILLGCIESPQSGTQEWGATAALSLKRKEGLSPKWKGLSSSSAGESSLKKGSSVH